jgi:hypothetical protein
MDLYYVNGDYGSVFESQVLALLESMNSLPGMNQVVLLCGYRNKQEKVEIIKRVNGKSFDVKFFKVFPNYPLFNLFNRISIAKALAGCVLSEQTIVHIRGELLAMLAFYPLKRAAIPVSHIIVDVRGVTNEEINQYSKLLKVLKNFKIKNSVSSTQFLAKFSNINAVSGRLREYIHQKANIPLEKVNVIPCLSGLSFVYNSVQRDKIRNKLGLKNKDNLFVFSSGAGGLWQKNEEIISVADKGYKVLNLSNNNIIHPNIFNYFLNYKEVGDYLSAADIALLIRDQSIVNQVASPVKFSEYVCSGLPVISNGNVDMVTEYIKTTGNGLIIMNLHDLNNSDVIRLRAISREKISQEGISTFSVNIISREYYSIYQRMLIS